MGAFKGAMSVRRYRVSGPPPKDQARLVKGVRAHVLIPIDPKGELERAHGWASIEDPQRLELTSEALFFGGTLALALRVDTLRPPAALVRRMVERGLRALGRKPNRAEQKAFKAEVVKDLRQKIFPVTRAIDVVWDVDGGRVYVHSHAKAPNELVVDLFKKSFGLELEADGPGQAAGRLGVRERLEPTPEMVHGFPGLPGQTAANDGDDAPDTTKIGEDGFDA